MNPQLPGNQQPVNIGVSIGTTSILAICISGLVTLDGASKYSGNLLTTILTFGYLTCGAIICFKRLINIENARIPALGKLTLTALSFSFTVAMIGAVVYYINARFLDTRYAENALKSSQVKWLAHHYSREAIAGQIELTDTFQDPAKWALSSGIFIMLISLVIFCVVGWFNLLRITTESRIRAD
jgi:hypothetical protein